MADNVVSAIQKVCAGLEYPSESDASFDLIQWDSANGEPSPEAVAKLAGQRTAKAGSMLVDEFFAALAETDDAVKFKALEQTLQKYLTDLRVFRVGKSPKVDIYVLGRAASGEWLGLHTTSVET